MTDVDAKLTVFFEEPFWVGIYERNIDGFLEVNKITFGTEPKDYDVYKYILLNFNKLEFTKPIKRDKSIVIDKKINPKRMQRLISNQLNSSISTKSQQALKIQHEQNKLNSKISNRKRLEQEKQKRFELKQQKKKQKHRGK